ncbi:hypothetical protein LAUMK41_05737 [Mycobacterium attenuatum]|nr:hypothetical protein LAUMK41_05737 [Mycobacterium attenuatum]
MQAPFDLAWLITASSSRVPALPTSSMITMVSALMRRNHAGTAPGPPLAVWTYLARVSVGAARSPPSSMAAEALGAKPMTVPPEERHAWARAAIAVVLPEPAGASARVTFRPPAAISSTSAIWPALRGLPRAAESWIAKSMSRRLVRRAPRARAAASMRFSASWIFWEVYWALPWRRYTLVPSRRRSAAGSPRSSSSMRACGSDSESDRAAAVMRSAKSAGACAAYPRVRM